NAKDSISYDKFTIVYTGGFYGPRRPEVFFEGLKRFFDDRPDARNRCQFVFIGRGLENYTRGWELDDIIVDKGYMSQKDVIRHLFQADILLLILGFDPNGAGVIPAKLPEYLPTSRPILSLVPEGETAGYLREFNDGCVITEPDPALVTAYLADQFARFEQRGDQPIKPSVAQIDKFTRQYQTKQLADLFDRAVENYTGK
ncbi:MAG: hypothetical protein V3T31_07180, partial [candidate division Zixibacteria bacterium]